MEIEFRLLGDVEVRFRGQPLTVGYAQLQGVLAVLLADADRAVAVDQLVDRVWGTRRLPRRPRGAVQHCMTLLRKTLATVPEVSIVRSPAGYRITADPGTVDLHRFQELIDRARDSDDDRASARLFEQALVLWRGEPFAGLHTPWFDSLRTTLVAQHQSVQLDLVDARLRRGQHAALLSELGGWVQQRPLDERLAGQYLIALYCSGLQAQALEHYERLRRCLADELGADPNPALQRLHRQILTADPALATPAAVPGNGSPGTVVPRQLPAGPRLFTGRDRELAQLTAALEDGGTMVVSAIAGAGGIGKTWLALHWAHQHLHRFPDGQLYANLRGFDPTGQPVPADRAVRGFLDALGVPDGAVPADPDAQAGLYRSLVADRRMLILLDNARDAAQVEPLLPGSPTCAVLVTSRNRLTGLVTTHGARHLNLDVFADHEARTLLARHLGRDRVQAEPAAVDDLLQYCASLPLALGIVATRAATHPGFPLAALADELRDHGHRLDALDGGDPTTNLAAVLTWSHRALSSDAAEVFELLGLANGPDIGLPAAASLTALPARTLATILRTLEAANLVQHHRPGRYRMHDLVRLYAAAQAARLPAQTRCAAQRRLVDFYLHTAYRGALAIDPQSPPLQLRDPAPGCQPEHLPDTASAMAWFAAEHRNVTASQQISVDHGWHAEVWQQAWGMNYFHFWRGLLPDVLSMWQAGLAAADHLGDVIAQVKAHRSLGTALARLDRSTEALRHHERALHLAEKAGDLREQAHTHKNVVTCWERRGDRQRALEHATAALHLFHTLGNPGWEAAGLNHVGWCHALLGHYDLAHLQCQTALDLFRDLSDPIGEAVALDSLGYIAHHTGRHADAVDHYRDALTLHRTLGYTSKEALALERLGHTHDALGQHQQARSVWQQALLIYQAQHCTTDAHRIRRMLGLVVTQ